jgi:hypothetical protein
MDIVALAIAFCRQVSRSPLEASPSCRDPIGHDSIGRCLRGHGLTDDGLHPALAGPAAYLMRADPMNHYSIWQKVGCHVSGRSVVTCSRPMTYRQGNGRYGARDGCSRKGPGAPKLPLRLAGPARALFREAEPQGAAGGDLRQAAVASPSAFDVAPPPGWSSRRASAIAASAIAAAGWVPHFVIRISA